MLYDVTFGVCGALYVRLEGYWVYPVWDHIFILVCNTFWCHILSTCPMTREYLLSLNTVNTGHNMNYK